MTPFSQFYRAAGLIAIATAMTAAAPMQSARWTPAWGSSQMRIDGPNADKLAKAGPATIRQIVHLTASGKTLRLRLSNVAGTTPLKIGAATIGLGTPGRSSPGASRLRAGHRSRGRTSASTGSKCSGPTGASCAGSRTVAGPWIIRTT